MLKVNHLSKNFGKIQAVKDITFHVKQGSTFAFLGTNGAGKSTVIHMIINLLKPDAGSIEFTNGTLQEKMGIVFQSHRLDEELTLEENLVYRAKLYGLNQKDAKKRINTLLELTNLKQICKRKYGKCSGGEQRKTDIIRALLHNPRLLILDEPTTGLDADSREEIWSLLHHLQIEQGLTIFLTTHYIEEAESVDYVLIMHEGRIEVEGTPSELRKRYSSTLLKLETKHRNALIKLLNAHDYPFELKNGRVIITLDSSKSAIPILTLVQDHIIDFSMVKASLEHVFLQVTEQLKRKINI